MAKPQGEKDSGTHLNKDKFYYKDRYLVYWLNTPIIVLTVRNSYNKRMIAIFID